MRMWKPESLLAIIGSSLLILSISFGSVSAVEATNAVPISPWLVAPCDFTEGGQELERRQGICASLFNLTAIAP